MAMAAGRARRRDRSAPNSICCKGAEKSYASFDVTTRNPGGHSSQPRADNAIYELAMRLQGIRAYEFPVMWNDWTIGGFKAAAATMPGEVGAAMAQFAAHPVIPQRRRLLSKPPSLVGRVRTTCVATMLKGGHADNALPQSASATVNCRIFPARAPTRCRRHCRRRPAPRQGDDERHALMPGRRRRCATTSSRRSRRRSMHDYPGVPIVPDQAPYATDGSIFRSGGDPDLRCLPVLHEAHRRVRARARTNASRSPRFTTGSTTGTCCSKRWLAANSGFRHTAPQFAAAQSGLRVRFFRLLFYNEATAAPPAD